MGRTLEDWFAELDRLLTLRHGAEDSWWLRKERLSPRPQTAEEELAGEARPRFHFVVDSGMDRDIGNGVTITEAVENACRNIVRVARRIVEAT